MLKGRGNAQGEGSPEVSRSMKSEATNTARLRSRRQKGYKSQDSVFMHV